MTDIPSIIVRYARPLSSVRIIRWEPFQALVLSGRKYELTSESQLQGLCYCTDCQRVGGSAHWTSYAVAPADFRLLEGTLTPYTYDPGSGRKVTRHFCGKCGTQNHGAIRRTRRGLSERHDL